MLPTSIDQSMIILISQDLHEHMPMTTSIHKRRQTTRGRRKPAAVVALVKLCVALFGFCVVAVQFLNYHNNSFQIQTNDKPSLKTGIVDKGQRKSYNSTITKTTDDRILVVSSSPSDNSFANKYQEPLEGADFNAIEENFCSDINQTCKAIVSVTWNTREAFRKSRSNNQVHLMVLSSSPSSSSSSLPSSSITAATKSNAQRKILCVPQKNGNRQFGALVLAMRNQRIPEDGKQVVKLMKTIQVDPKDVTMDDQIYFVARNPYTRILSLYLQKIKTNACISQGQLGCGVGNKGRGQYLNLPHDATFTQFIESIHTNVRRRQQSLCQVDHHLCTQVSNCVVTTMKAKSLVVLKLEEQSLWFPRMVGLQEMELQQRRQYGYQGGFWESTNINILQNDGWLEFGSSYPCYYTPTGNCTDMFHAISPERIRRQNKIAVTTGTVHATGASDVEKLNMHYTPETAKLVYELYAKDFELLNYSYWDGVSKFRL